MVEWSQSASLMTCLRPTQLCGGGQTKRKSFDFLLLVHSQLCGGGQTKRKLFHSPLPIHSLFSYVLLYYTTLLHLLDIVIDPHNPYPIIQHFLQYRLYVQHHLLLSSHEFSLELESSFHDLTYKNALRLKR